MAVCPLVILFGQLTKPVAPVLKSLSRILLGLRVVEQLQRYCHDKLLYQADKAEIHSAHHR
jgi:hypothetical protein